MAPELISSCGLFRETSGMISVNCWHRSVVRRSVIRSALRITDLHCWNFPNADFLLLFWTVFLPSAILRNFPTANNRSSATVFFTGTTRQPFAYLTNRMPLPGAFRLSPGMTATGCRLNMHRSPQEPGRSSRSIFQQCCRLRAPPG